MARYSLYPRDMLGEKCPSPSPSIPLQEGSYEGQPPPCSSSHLFTQQTLSSGLLLCEAFSKGGYQLHSLPSCGTVTGGIIGESVVVSHHRAAGTSETEQGEGFL